MEEDSGYRSSDREMNRPPDDQDQKIAALRSSNPTYQALAATGLSAELPTIENAISQEQLSGLSPFTRWLKTLGEPTLDFTHAESSEVVAQIETAREESQPAVEEEQESAKPARSEKKKSVKKKKKKKKKKAGKKDGGSDPLVVLSDDVFSETLAELLVEQGHYSEAIVMYQKMRLIYPEKSRLFAAKIAELINKA